MGHVAFQITDFWPHDPTTWFRKMESKFRICNIRQSSTKYDHLIYALPTDICSSINDSLPEIDENTADAYEQLKALLMSRYTMDSWARAFELHKFPEIGDMKPSEMRRQMKALLPPDSTPGTYFMTAFLLRLPHRSNAQPAGPQLAGADGRSTSTWGTIRRRLSFGLRTFFVTFLLAAVYRPILGLDFLSPTGCWSTQSAARCWTRRL